MAKTPQTKDWNQIEFNKERKNLDIDNKNI